MCFASLPSIELRPRPIPYLFSISLLLAGTCPTVHTVGLKLRKVKLALLKFEHIVLILSTSSTVTSTLLKIDTHSHGVLDKYKLKLAKLLGFCILGLQKALQR